MASESQFRIKRGDTLPDLVASLTERDPASADQGARRPLDLSGVDQVKFFARTRDNKRSITGDCVIDNPDVDDPTWVDHPELSPYSYKVRYAWTTDDTEIATVYLGEFELTYVGGGVQTVPARGYFEIVVEEDKG